MTRSYRRFTAVPLAFDQTVAWRGRDAVQAELHAAAARLDRENAMVAVDCYTGLHDDEVLALVREAFRPVHVELTTAAMKSSEVVDALVQRDLTDDPVFGFLTSLQLTDFFDADKLGAARRRIAAGCAGLTLVYGPGATLMCDPDLLIYADMPRWEHQLRYRRNEVGNLGVSNLTLKGSLKYKRGYFVDWRVCDRHKKRQMDRWDYLLDTTVVGDPKLVTGDALRQGLRHLTRRPFSLMPVFDPGPWGGQWLRETCGLDGDAPNYAWCFNCIVEENSLLLQFNDVPIEIPAINLVFYQPRQLLGEAVHGRFGDEFPIRFDFLDTMGGGNLSLQVHPITEYIQEKFGIHYTQDESYYLMEAAPGAKLYLGLKEGVDPEAMMRDLQHAQDNGAPFDADRYAASWPIKKHDHALIPGGTVHSSGKDCMVLEIAATTYIFTFKLWDWGRLGLDGNPRPIHLEHGAANIAWECQEAVVQKQLLNQFQLVAEGDGWREERTGLHEREFIETRRHWFTKPVEHNSGGGVNVLCLIEGQAALVTSPTDAFEPFEIRYAETFIVPATVGRYVIRPLVEQADTPLATMKGYVRT
ncbi:MAG: class I mannose-6-phosphate isomerase [Verrucomicrobia bacterium]|nr:class I mannose-6-phosphate isomerase [Verrucomicrobiota bacterium]